MIERDRLIIGLTGSLGSGVSTVAKYLLKAFKSKVYRITGKNWDSEVPTEISDEAYKLSRIIEEKVEKDGQARNAKGEFDRELLQRIGNELRQENPSHLAIDILKRISQIEEKVGGKHNYPIIIDGIKNSGEIEEFRKHHMIEFLSILDRCTRR